MHWEKNIKNTKDGTINHHPLHTLQLLLVLQKSLRGIGISTISANSNDSTPSITPTIPQFSFSIFSNGPTMLHYLFHNYYQLAILPSTMPYTDNYHTPSVVSSTEIYGGLSREKIEATRLQQCVEIEALEFENRKAVFLEEAHKQKLRHKQSYIVETPTSSCTYSDSELFLSQTLLFPSFQMKQNHTPTPTENIRESSPVSGEDVKAYIL